MCFSSETRIPICALIDYQLCMCDKDFYVCMKNQFAEKLVLVIYWPL